MKRKTINYTTSLVLTAIFFIVGITGILIFPGFLQFFGVNLNSLPKVQIYKFHNWFGLLLMIIVSIHAELHWKRIVGMTKRLFGKTKLKKKIKSKRKIANYLIGISLFVPYFLVVFTGIIKFPGFLPFLGINPLTVPINEISAIHDWSGVIAVCLTFIHLALHLKWLKSTTKSFVQSIKKSNIKKKKVVIVTAIVVATLMTVFTFPNPSSPIILGFDIFNSSEGTISISGVGSFTYNPNNMTTLRKDIFQEGYFSVFDILVYLHNNDQINMKYHFNEKMNTYVIDSINGISNWWYEAYYDGGWPEFNVFRMDHYPYKEKMTIEIYHMSASDIDEIYDEFKKEVDRKQQNNGKIIIPTVIIRGTKETLSFSNVEVTSHNLRNDVFQKNIVTAIDVILTLGDEGKLTYDLQWYDSIGSAEVVRSYWIDGIDEDKSVGRCGFVYEEGSYQFSSFRGNHIHIPSDTRVLTSPEYIEWFWICI
ncbi:MAG: cytochrome b/b6 domain-containing protein [Thermoplasmatales archaeon]|nr:MAG: cytochrome b/b6 domain-containing protein [Thermoplasmatales archaeon]